MRLVYILSEQTEYGGGRMTATLDPSHLTQMIDDNWPDLAYPGWREEAKNKLARVIASRTDDLPPGAIGLHDGWGGLVLDIVRLF